MSFFNIRIPNLADVGTRARYKAVTGTNPAANAETVLTVPAGKNYKLVSASVSVAQGATQTPLPALTIKDSAGTVVFQQNAATAAISASTTSQCNWHSGAVITAGAALTTNQAPLPPDIVLGPLWTLETVTAGKGANTDLAALSALVVELS
jgi:hypothetical protein